MSIGVMEGRYVAVKREKEKKKKKFATGPRMKNGVKDKISGR